MYYWQSDTPTQFTSQGDWDSERKEYGSYDGKIKPNVKPKIKVASSPEQNQESLNFELGNGIRQEVVKRRLRAGWSQDDALNKPLAPRRTKARNVYIGCQRFTLVEFARHIGVAYTQLNYKFRRDRITKTHWQEWEVAQLIEQWYEKSIFESQ